MTNEPPASPQIYDPAESSGIPSADPRESEERLRAVFTTTDDAIVMIDERGVIKSINPAAERVFGYPAAELSGQRFSVLIAPFHRQEHERCIDDYIRTGDASIIGSGREFHGQRKDGTVFPLKLAVSEMQFNGRRAFAGFVKDITELKHAGEMLAQNEQQLTRAIELYRTVAGNMSEGLYAVNAQDVVTYMNPAAEQLFGYSRSELLGRRMHDMTHYQRPDGSPFPAAESAVLQVLQTRVPLRDFEDVFIRKDGTFFPVVYNVSPIHADGDVAGLVVVFRDVTKEKEARQTLEEGRARLAGIVHSAMDAILSVDGEQRIVLFNAAAEKMFRCPASDAVGTSLDRFIPARFRAAHAQHIRRFGETGVSSRAMGHLGAISGVRANGEEFPIEASISKIKVASGTLFTVILRDITERKRAEEELQVRERQQRAILELTQHALAGCDVDRLMNDAVALAAQILDVEFAKILELTASKQELVLCAGIGWTSADVEGWRESVGRESQAGYTLMSNVPVVVEDLAEEARFRTAPILAAHKVVSGMTAVIQGRSGPFGVLGAHSTRRHSFSLADVHFLQSLANVLATAIERRELEAELLDSIAREQRRIGQDLHDDLCQRLTGIALRADALTEDLPANSPAQEELAEIADLLRAANQQARLLARGLTPVELEANGLMSALQELAAHCTRLHRVECQFRCDKPLLLASNFTATHLYRIAQEAISNAVRHGRAKTISIALQHRRDEGVLTITNDGSPLPPAPGRAGGMGLRIMQYRAELIGATIRLASTAEGKTAVVCTFRTDR